MRRVAFFGVGRKRSRIQGTEIIRWSGAVKRGGSRGRWGPRCSDTKGCMHCLFFLLFWFGVNYRILFLYHNIGGDRSIDAFGNNLSCNFFFLYMYYPMMMIEKMTD